MLHAMRLHPLPFDRVKQGSKTIELRLADEKRRKIHVGDKVEFNSRDTGETVRVVVTDLEVANSVLDILKKINLARIESQATEQEIVNDMRQYYTLEDESKYGVLAIGFQKQV